MKPIDPQGLDADDLWNDISRVNEYLDLAEAAAIADLANPVVQFRTYEPLPLVITLNQG